MAIKTRSGGISTRGGGGGRGSITVNDHTGEAISTGVRTIEWQTLDKYGFTSTVDPSDPTKVIIGDAPEFLAPIVWSSLQNTQVRVSESDPAEPDAYLTNGKENTVMAATTGNFDFRSTVGRGFGPDAKLTVKAYHAGKLIDEQEFDCASNGTIMKGNIIVSISNYAEDGDGSVFQGKFNISVLSKRIVGETFSGGGSENSGECRVEVSFKEQKWEDTISISQDIFKDKNPNTPNIDGGSTVRDHDDASKTITKFISGIQYFDLGSLWQFESLDISNLNEDSSHPNANLTVDAEELGITTYTTSPWGSDADEWQNVTNLDTLQGVDYITERGVNKSNFRHVGTAVVNNIIRDSWNDAPFDESNTLKVCIDTFSQPSSDTVEYFTEENMRLDNDYITAWDSEEYCVDGEAVVFGDSLYHGADLPRILENITGSLGSSGSLSDYLPDRKSDGSLRQNPNYTGHSREYAGFNRVFTPPNPSATYAGFSMNILTNGDLDTLLRNQDLKIYIWKEDSVSTTSPNVGIPDPYNPTNPLSNDTGSIWLHGSNDYNFGTFTDGATQDNANATCRTKVTGTLAEGTFSGNDLIGSIYVKVLIKKGVTVSEISTTFV